MSIHADPRQNDPDPEVRADWQRDLRLEYAREEYEMKYPYEDNTETECLYQSKDGGCTCDGSCIHQIGKWKDTCSLWEGGEVNEC